MSRAQLAAIVFGSHEYHGEAVENAYLELLGRSADSAGEAYWTGQLDGGKDDEEIIVLVASSSEYFGNGKPG